MYVYVLELNGNKYFVGQTNLPVNISFEKYSNDTIPLWIDKYWPIGFIEIIPDCDEYDADKQTIKYMQKYGIDNVRGGTFSAPILSRHNRKTIEDIIFKDDRVLCSDFKDKCCIRNRCLE